MNSISSRVNLPFEYDMEIIKLFATLIPTITFLGNIASLIIVSFGGYFVINNNMTIGDFTAFNNYLMMLIFPIITIGFISNILAQATSSFSRISQILNSKEEVKWGNANLNFKNTIKVENIFLRIEDHNILKNISCVLGRLDKNWISSIISTSTI